MSAVTVRITYGTGRTQTSCRAFTLLESLMATGLLLGVVIAVTAAISAGQQNALEAHQQIAGALAAEELMGRLATEPYSALASWDGYTEAVGDMSDMHGVPMASTMQMVGRDVHVISGMKAIAAIDVRVRGLTVTVRSFNAQGRTLASLSRFVPEPQS